MGDLEAVITKYDQGEQGYVRYVIQVSWRDLSWSLVRRFNDFVQLQEAILSCYPNFKGRLPPKRWFGRFHPDFLKERRMALQEYLDHFVLIHGILELRASRIFLELDKHVNLDTSAGKMSMEGGADMDYSRGAAEHARTAAIMEETVKSFINISLVSIEQMDPSELAQHRRKILERAQGFKQQAGGVHRVLCEGKVEPVDDMPGPDNLIDILSRPARLPLSLQHSLVEKKGLAIADSLRESSKAHSGDDQELVCHLE